MRHGLLFEQGAGRVLRLGVKHGGCRSLPRARAHTGAATRSDSEAQRVQQDGFSRAGFAREHIETRAEFQRGLFDQHNVADRQRGKHERTRFDRADVRKILRAAAGSPLGGGREKSRQNAT
jgi:hypothetical protein